jgi:hypothetical protein
MTQTTSEQEQRQINKEKEERNKRLGIWNPRDKANQITYLAWLEKQANQRQKTFELEGATHSPEYKKRLKREKKLYEEEAKRIKDLIEDGR